MVKWVLMVCIVATALLCPANGNAQQPPEVVIEENTGLASGVTYQKWNVREITEVFQEKNFNSPILAVLQPGDLVWGIIGDVHSRVIGKILVTRDHQIRGDKWLREGELIYPLYSLGNGVYKFWHQGDVLINSLLDIRGLFPAGENRPPVEGRVWGVSLEDLRRPGGEEWWVKIRMSDDRIGWINRPYHFGNNGLFAHSGISVIIDNRVVVFDSPPLFENGVVWVSASTLAEYLGAVTRWDEQRGILALSLEGKDIQLIKDSRAAIFNGAVLTMDAAPRMLNGQIFVPVRAVAEALGRSIAWDGETRQVRIAEGH